jgi:hypothetical protein
LIKERNLFDFPPCGADFPDDVAEKFRDGQPWFNVLDELL